MVVHPHPNHARGMSSFSAGGPYGATRDGAIATGTCGTTHATFCARQPTMLRVALLLLPMFVLRHGYVSCYAMHMPICVGLT